MADSNQALSWIVFKRDRERFQAEFPELRMEATSYLPWLSYLLSGGVKFRSLVPGFLTGPVTLMDALLRPLDPVFAPPLAFAGAEGRALILSGLRSRQLRISLESAKLAVIREEASGSACTRT